MEKNYTQENLIQFIYREDTVTDHLELENAIDNDVDLKSTYKEMKIAVSALPRVQFMPSKSVIDRILNYSRKTSLEAHC